MIATAAFRDAGQTAATGRRHTADERRAQVLEAAIHEFALHGLHQATVAAIGVRAKISQPYVFALFRDKKTLFLAAQDRVREDITAALTAADKLVGLAAWKQRSRCVPGICGTTSTSAGLAGLALLER